MGGHRDGLQSDLNLTFKFFFALLLGDLPED